ncbi:MAG TPA: UDP-3-O-(3-hydroxymyristoyl)glucosamine N-acyltransferase, partial [Gemmatimonadetes bacterium]|nr:UDP-3-O-(3-hydroxymyristoyl)glucosamine N-acyltransferase [Gemmatimonadota bacterium]
DGATMFGFPARPRSEGLRKEASLASLPRLRARVSELERDVTRLLRELGGAEEGSE